MSWSGSGSGATHGSMPRPKKPGKPKILGGKIRRCEGAARRLRPVPAGETLAHLRTLPSEPQGESLRLDRPLKHPKSRY